MTKKITRKEDAASIVGPEIAEELEIKSKATAMRSDAIVEMSEAETEEETLELVEEIEESEIELSSPEEIEVVNELGEELYTDTIVEEAERKDVSPADKKRAVKKYGNVKYADPTNKKYPVDTEEHIRAAWNYIHQEKNAAKYPDHGAAIKKRILSAWKKVIGGTPPSAEKKSVEEMSEDATMGAAVNSPADYVANLPYGGATSMRDAEDYVEAKNEAIYLMDMWSVFSNVVWNIMDRQDITDKRAVLNSAVDEFKNVLTAKAMVAFSVVEKSEPVATVVRVDAHELQPALDVLLDAIDNSLQLEADTAGKLNSINPALAELGEHISQYVVSKSKANPVPQTNVDILVQIKELIQPLAEKVSILAEDVNTIKSQARASETPIRQRIPAPRTLRADQVDRPVQPTVKSETPKLSEIIRKSVGL